MAAISVVINTYAGRSSGGPIYRAVPVVWSSPSDHLQATDQSGSHQSTRWLDVTLLFTLYLLFFYSLVISLFCPGHPGSGRVESGGSFLRVLNAQ